MSFGIIKYLYLNKILYYFCRLIFDWGEGNIYGDFEGSKALGIVDVL